MQTNFLLFFGKFLLILGKKKIFLIFYLVDGAWLHLQKCVGLDLFLSKEVPINVFEEGVSLNLVYSNACLRVLAQHASQQVHDFARKETWQLEFGILNAIVKFLDIVSIEWRDANQQLVQDRSKLINVRRLANTLLG